MGGWEVGKLRNWQAGKFGGQGLGRLRGWEVGRLENWKVGQLGGSEVGSWEVVKLGSC